MRKKEKQVKDQQIINEMLNSAEICHISVSDEKAPYTFAVNYAYEEGKLYIHSAHEGRKIDLLKKNNNVCFNVEGHTSLVSAPKACGWTAKYRSIIGYGEIQISDDEDLKIKGMDLIMKKYGAEGKQVYAKGALKAMCILVLNIDSLEAKQSGSWE